MSKYQGKRKRIMYGQKWIAAAMLAIFAVSQVTLAVFAEISANGRYENRYDDISDLGQFNVTEGDGGGSVYVINTDKNILPYPVEPGGVAEMRLIKNGKVTDGNFNHEFKENPVFSFGENEKVSVEMKFRFSQKGNVKNLLRLDDTSGTTSINGEALLQFDDGQIFSTSSSGKQLLAGSKGTTQAYDAGKWYHAFLILTGNTYDVYFKGSKLNTEPLKMSNGSLSKITRVVNSHRTWSDESSYYDDLIIQPLTELRLDSSSIADGAAAVSEKTKELVLDFNTPLDASTVSNITVEDKQGTFDSASYSVEIDSLDTTRVHISFLTNLTLSNTYTVKYNGLTDLLGSSSESVMQFSTRETPSAAEMVCVFPEEGAVSVPRRTTVAFTFNKPIDVSSLSADCVQVSPAATIDSVALQDENTVVISFANALKPNCSYTVELTDGVLDSEDGLKVSPACVHFTTAYTDDMVVDEFEFENEGFIPNLVGITDNSGKVVNPQTVTNPKNQLKLSIETANPDNYDGDTSRIFLGGSVDDTRLIYKLDGGIRDAELSVFSNLSPSMPSAAYDLQFAVAESLTDLNNSDGLIDVTEKVEKTLLSQNAKDGFYPYSYTYRAENDYYPYFVIRMRRLMEGSAWTPKVANVKFNSLPPAAAKLSVIGDSNAVQLDTVKELAIPFTGVLDSESVRSDIFKINGRTPGSAVLNAEGNKVVLGGIDLPQYSSYITLELTDGLVDAYGRSVDAGTYTLLAPHVVTLKEAVLKGETALPASGSIIPSVTLLCGEDGVSAYVYAVYYIDNKIADIKMHKADGLLAGDNKVTLPEMNITTNAAGSRLEIFVRTDAKVQRPVSETVIVDANGIHN